MSSKGKYGKGVNMLIQDLSVKVLMDVMADAFFEAELSDESEIYIKEGLEFPMWVSLLEDNTILRVHSYIPMSDDVDELAALRLANRINSKYAPNAISVSDDGNLWTYYFEYIEGPVEAKKIISTLRRCSSAFVAGIRNEDEDELIS